MKVDVAVIGAGIAGASAAAFLIGNHRVAMIEQESQPGWHATGRSAALFSETYGNSLVRALSVGSRSFLMDPPDGFSDHPLLTPRGVLHVGTAGDEDVLDRVAEEGRALVSSVRRLSAAEAMRHVPALRSEWVSGGVLEPDACDIDTHAVLSGFLRMVRAGSGNLMTDAQVTALAREGQGWLVTTTAGVVEAKFVINAAGAWGDQIAVMAGIKPVGLGPKRRTAFTFSPPAGMDIRSWPMLMDVREQFYFKPDAGNIIASLADETPSPPCDAQADDYDVALAVDRIQTAADLSVTRINRSWAGLRSFVADRSPVVGPDPAEPSFIWCVAQGGYGFQTVSAMGRMVAALTNGDGVPGDLAALGVTAAALAPDRPGL